MAKKEIIKEIEIPENIKVSVDKKIFSLKDEKGEVILNLKEPSISIILKDNKIILKSTKGTKNEKKILFTYVAKFKNAFKGLEEGFLYKLKICSGHFPMNVSYNNKEFLIKNFFGEKVPRKFKVKYDNVNIKVQGEIITVESPDKELAGQIAANIEQLCRRPGFDSRIFQDGIYITSKAGKEI